MLSTFFFFFFILKCFKPFLLHYISQLLTSHNDFFFQLFSSSSPIFRHHTHHTDKILLSLSILIYLCERIDTFLFLWGYHDLVFYLSTHNDNITRVNFYTLYNLFHASPPKRGFSFLLLFFQLFFFFSFLPIKIVEWHKLIINVTST